MTKKGRVEAEEAAQRVAKFLATAKDRRLKLTPQRLEIFREVASSLDHPDAETVYGAIHARMPTVSLDTVYRTLWTLSELGLVSTLGLRHENVRFDANPRNHHHWVCVRCGLTRDFECAGLRGLRLPGTVKALGDVVSTHIEVRGVCESCGRKSARKGTESSTGPTGRKGRLHV
jgi:Fur family transcriptional regulator, peroxide stress response regulator